MAMLPGENAMRRFLLCALSLFPLALTGCVAKTAVAVVAAPVQIASRTADLLTTSQSEADQRRGRELRKNEQRLDELQRRYDKLVKRCQDGISQACNDATTLQGEIDVLSRQVPEKR